MFEERSAASQADMTEQLAGSLLGVHTRPMDIHIRARTHTLISTAFGTTFVLSLLIHYLAPDWKIFVYGIWAGIALCVATLFVNQYLHRSL